MKIVLMSNMYNIGGGEKNLVELACSIKKNNNDILVLLPCRGQLSEELEKNGIRYYCVGNVFFSNKFVKIFSYIFCSLKIIYKFYSINFKPDIIHCNSLGTIYIAKIIAMVFKSKVIWTCHGLWEIPNKIKKRILDKIIDRTFAITPEIYDALPFSNKTLNPLGIDVRNLKLYNGKRKNHKIRLLCIARWQYIKGQDILIQAFNEIYKKVPDLELHFYGGILTNNDDDRKFYEENKNFIKKMNLDNRVYFHNYDPDIRFKIHNYDMLCIPSRYESFSIVLLEGLNCGMRVIAPDVGGPRFIIQNGKSGILFKTEDVEDLKDKLINLINGDFKLDAQMIIERGREFSIEEQCRKSIKVYTDILKHI